MRSLFTWTKIIALACLWLGLGTGISSAEYDSQRDNASKENSAKRKNDLANVQTLILPSAFRVCTSYQNRNSSNCGWRFNVEQSDEINAFAHGSNQITIFSGLMDNWVQSQEELAFIVAHEIAHHIAGHVDSSRNRINTGSLLGVIGGVAASNRLEDDEEKLEVLGQSVELAARLGFLLYSKQQEAEADEIALKIMSATEYDVREARNLLIRMSKSSQGASSFFDTHPSGTERLLAFDRAIVSLPSQTRPKIQAAPDGYEIGIFEYMVGSYCIYTTASGKEPTPKVEGCPARRLFKLE